MVKIETIKNEYIEFKVFGAARVFTQFEKEKGKSLNTYFSEHQTDVEAMALALYLGHVAWSKLTDSETTLKDPETILDKMDIDQVASGVMTMLGIVPESEGKKK